MSLFYPLDILLGVGPSPPRSPFPPQTNDFNQQAYYLGQLGLQQYTATTANAALQSLLYGGPVMCECRRKAMEEYEAKIEADRKARLVTCGWCQKETDSLGGRCEFCESDLWVFATKKARKEAR